METSIFNLFTRLFRIFSILIPIGVVTAVLINIQRLAFQSKKSGLISMTQINKQLVGKTK